MNRLCIDTPPYGNFRRGDERAIELIDGADWMGVSTIVVGELEAGFAAGGRRRRNKHELASFCADPAVETLVVDEAVARIYAEIVTALRAARTPLPTNDLWIAATAARHGAAVLTYDAHFAQVQRVGAIVLARTKDA